MPEPRQLAPLALAQLAAWQGAASEHSLTVVYRGNGIHLICSEDYETVFPIADGQGNGYRFALADLTAAVVAHLRNRHRDLEAKVYENGRQDKKAVPDAGNGRTVHSRGAYPD